MLLRMSAAAEARRLTIVGLAVLLCLTAIGLLVVVDPFRSDETSRLSVVMDVPYVGQGVAAGSPVMMHGVKVGDIAAVSGRTGGGVRLQAVLQTEPTIGLTDSLGIDFRPANYFGVTAINLLPGQGGRPLRDGMRIDTVPQGNFTLQALLSRLGEITGGVVTPQLIQVIDRATRYTDGLNPLLETMLTAAGAVTKVQTISSAQLLKNATGVSVAFPGFVDAATAAGYNFNQGSGFVVFNVSGKDALPGQDNVPTPGAPQTEEFWKKRSVATLDLLANSFFGALGKLLSTHPDDLIPAVELVQTLTAAVPGMVTPQGISETLVELRKRFEKLYAGSGEQRALQVHIVLDSLPGVAAPINAIGGP